VVSIFLQILIISNLREGIKNDKNKTFIFGIRTKMTAWDSSCTSYKTNNLRLLNNLARMQCSGTDISGRCGVFGQGILRCKCRTVN